MIWSPVIVMQATQLATRGRARKKKHGISMESAGRAAKSGPFSEAKPCGLPSTKKSFFFVRGTIYRLGKGYEDIEAQHRINPFRRCTQQKHVFYSTVIPSDLSRKRECGCKGFVSATEKNAGQHTPPDDISELIFSTTGRVQAMRDSSIGAKSRQDLSTSHHCQYSVPPPYSPTAVVLEKTV
ncbi:unnamed protein product, partial [Laminaria digitata]